MKGLKGENMKILNNMSEKEIKMEIENNNDLREKLIDISIENDMYYIHEIMDTLKEGLNDYSIGFYNNNYIKVNDYLKLIDSCMNCQQNYGIFYDEEINLFKKGKVLNERIEYHNNCEGKQFDRLYKRTEEINKQIENTILNRLNSLTNYYFIEHEENLLETLYYLMDMHTIYIKDCIEELIF